MSHDGMTFDDQDKMHRTQSMNNELADGEQEEMVIDSGNEYRMISIMRQKRPVLTKDPFSDTIIEDAEENKLTTIEEAQTLRWSAIPKFGADEIQSPAETVTEESANIKGHTEANYLRSKFMQKLSLNHMLDPTGHKAKTSQTIIIWDWDDTLMASTFLSPF
jgi:hypothetical protein